MVNIIFRIINELLILLYVILQILNNSMFLLITFLSLFTFTINILFGMLRARVKRFSLLWFIYIHTPVIFIILFRRFINIDTIWYSYIFTIMFFFAGQRFGIFLRNRFFNNSVNASYSVYNPQHQADQKD